MSNLSQQPLAPIMYSPWYLRYIMVIAFLIMTVSLMDRYVVSILLEQIKVDLSLTDTQLGWLVGPAFVVTHVICQLPLARIADRSVRRNLIIGAMGLWSLFTIAAGFAKSFPQLLVARMGVGISEAACAPSLTSILSDYFPIGKRGRAMSMITLGGTAGVGAGMLLGGFAGEAYGWRIALIAAGVPGVLLTFVVWLTVREPVRGGSDEGVQTGSRRQVSAFEAVRILTRKRTFNWLIIGASLSYVTSIGRGAWEPVFLMRIYELDQSTAGLTYFLISPLPSLVGGFLGGLLVDRLAGRDLRWYLWLPAIVTPLSFPLMAGFLLWPVGDTVLFDALPVGFVFSIFGSVVAALASPATLAVGQTISPPAMRAMAHALWTIAANLVGMGLGPVIAGALSENLAPAYGQDSLRYALLIVSSVAIPSGIAFYIGARSFRRDLNLGN